MGCHALLWWIFLTQGLNQRLLRLLVCKWTLSVSHHGSPFKRLPWRYY